MRDLYIIVCKELVVQLMLKESLDYENVQDVDGHSKDIGVVEIRIAALRSFRDALELLL